MSVIRIQRAAAAALALAGCAAGVVAASASSAPARTAAPPSPPARVIGIRITRRPGTLAPGTRVRSSSIFGNRVFTDARHGYALGSPGDADYALVTTNGGRTWRTAGPALHLHAAQAPLAVVNIGALNRRTVFAWGEGQVVDSTGNGGRTWYSALWGDGGPIAVEGTANGHLIAFIEASDFATVWEYTSANAGRAWTYVRTVH